jgi:Tol biopolymer transport system component
MIGQTISHYRIVEKLGEGGMGVVYKAEDLRLDRTVALKFLAPHLVSDPESRQRFLREAKAAAALDHPNICTVHEIGEAEGQTFLAMAFVDGSTVAQKIQQRPIPLDEALGIAIQAGGGLQAAHDQGIVHRDIKSANVMVSRRGRVQIMDFGLALLADRTRLTDAQTALGTTAYMSPEQAQRLPVDRRADIWSLAVVLYEMVTGQLPFGSEHPQAVVYAVLHEEPEPMTGLRLGVPIELDRLVRKALAKKPEERYQHVEEFVVDLKAVEEQLKRSAAKGGEPKAALAGQGVSGPMGVAPPPTQPARSKQRTAWIVTGAVAGLAVALAVFSLRPEKQSLEPIAFSVNTGTPPPETYGGSPAVSPDGRAVAYVAQDESGLDMLWIRRLDSNDARALQGTQGARRPFWSPDGRFLAFFTGGQLKKIDSSGGPPIVICEAGPGLGGAWSPAGDIVFSPANRTPLHRVPARGGVSTPLTALDSERGENSHRWPQFLPDGRRFLFTIRAADPQNTVLAAGSLDSPQVQRLFRVQSNVRFAPAGGERSGYLLFALDRTLLAQPFDVTSLELRGEPAGVTQGLLHNVVSVFADFSVSDNGDVLVYSRGSGLHQLGWFDRAGKRLESIAAPGQQIQPRLSPDGKKLAVSMPDPYTGNRDIWVMELAAGVPQRLTFSPSNDWQPTWSPDGSRIVFTSDRNGGREGLYQLSPSGGSNEEELSDDGAAPSDWSPNGGFVLFVRSQPSANPNLWLLPLAPPREPIAFLHKQFAETDPHFSPDGRWIAYTSNESGRAEVYVAPAPKALTGVEPGPEGPRQVSTAGGAGARWRRDGRELFYLAPDHNLMSVEVKAGDRFEASVPKALFTTCDRGFWTAYWQSSYDVAGDGQRFLFNCPAESVSPVEVVVNWTAKLGSPGQP